MTQPAPHSNPFDAFFQQMEARIIAAVATHTAPAPALDFSEMGLEPLRAYSAEEVAHLLGLNRVQSVYEISQDELPRVKRVGSKIGYLGINVLTYMHGLPPIDVAGYIEQFRQRLFDERPNVMSLRPNQPGKRRVM